MFGNGAGKPCSSATASLFGGDKSPHGAAANGAGPANGRFSPNVGVPSYATLSAGGTELVDNGVLDLERDEMVMIQS